MTKLMVKVLVVLMVFALPLSLWVATSVATGAASQPVTKATTPTAVAPSRVAAPAQSIVIGPKPTATVVPAQSAVSTQSSEAIEASLKNEAILNKIDFIQVFGSEIYIRLKSAHTLTGVVNYKADTLFVCDQNEATAPNTVQSVSDLMMELCKHITSTNAIGRTYSVNESAMQYQELFDAAVSLANYAYGETMKAVFKKNVSEISSESCLNVYSKQSSIVHNKWKLSENPSIEFEIYKDSYDCSMSKSGLISYTTLGHKITINFVLPYFTPLLPTDPKTYDGYMDQPMQSLYYNGLNPNN